MPVGAAWASTAAGLALGSLVCAGFSGLEGFGNPVPLTLALDWQPALAASEPWRWWTAAFVHLSVMHLWINVGAALLVGALGVVARMPSPWALGWLLAWPATQLGLAIDPRLLHYGGLSGVLHAGAAMVAMHAIARGRVNSQRWIGIALLAGLVIKVISESPWVGPVQWRPGLDIWVAPIAHATGLVAGLLASFSVLAAVQLRIRATRAVVE